MSLLINIGVASENPVKVSAVREVFKRVFPEKQIVCQGYSVASGVQEQPCSDEETKQGAYNRLVAMKNNHPNLDYWVTIEAGIDHIEHQLVTFAYFVLATSKEIHWGRSASLPLPNHMLEQLQQGVELGSILDKQFNQVNVKQNAGAMGLLTNHLTNRQATYEHGLLLLCAPLLNPQIYA